MKKKSKSESGEPAYKKWTTIFGAVVAVASLLLNVWLGMSNLKLQKEKAAFDIQMSEIKLENERLDQLVRLRKMSVDLESRYLVVSGMAVFKVKTSDPGNPSDLGAIVQNRTLDDLNVWFDSWSVGRSLLEDMGGLKATHGVILYRISNRGEQDAQRVVLTIKWKDFSNDGEADNYIWDLETADWQEETVRLADLAPGQSVIVPLMHVLGTSKYFGRVVMPLKIEWYNPTLQKNESMMAQDMAPEDQWISGGLDITVAQ